RPRSWKKVYTGASGHIAWSVSTTRSAPPRATKYSWARASLTDGACARATPDRRRAAAAAGGASVAARTPAARATRSRARARGQAASAPGRRARRSEPREHGGHEVAARDARGKGIAEQPRRDEHTGPVGHDEVRLARDRRELTVSPREHHELRIGGDDKGALARGLPPDDPLGGSGQVETVESNSEDIDPCRHGAFASGRRRGFCGRTRGARARDRCPWPRSRAGSRPRSRPPR